MCSVILRFSLLRFSSGHGPQAIPEVVSVLVLLDPKLHVLGSVSDLPEVAVDALDKGITAVAQLSGDRVDGDRRALVECLECYEVGEPTNIKDVSRQLFTEIRNATKLANLGNNREQFAAQFLLPALRSTHMVYEELREDVFG